MRANSCTYLKGHVVTEELIRLGLHVDELSGEVEPKPHVRAEVLEVES